MLDLGHWTSTCPEIESPIGFIYLIVNHSKQQAYIGQKSTFRKVTKPPLKGKKKKRRSLVDSDWRTYCSSSKRLQEDIAAEESRLSYHILYWCSSKSELNYVETKLQFDVEVISDDRWYNGMVNIRQGKTVFGEDWKTRYQYALDNIDDLF